MRATDQEWRGCWGLWWQLWRKVCWRAHSPYSCWWDWPALSTSEQAAGGGPHRTGISTEGDNKDQSEYTMLALYSIHDVPSPCPHRTGISSKENTLCQNMLVSIIDLIHYTHFQKTTNYGPQNITQQRNETLHSSKAFHFLPFIWLPACELPWYLGVIYSVLYKQRYRNRR